MKYIVLQTITEKMAREFPIIFPDALTHSVVADALRMICPELNGAKPVSAGFISSTCVGDKGACHGKSESLNIKSRNNKDDELLKMIDYSHGIIP